MLTFADEPLLFPEDSSGINAWLERYYAIADLSPFCPPAACRSPLAGHRSRFEQDKGLGLPVLNYPEATPPRLNQIYWPTGPTRWARAYFLVSKTTKDKIVQKCHSSSNNISQKLKWADEKTSLEASMFCLPPRQVADPSGATGDSLWLLTLVDDRYWWQYKDFGDNTVTTSTDWSSLISTLGSQFGITVSVSSIASAYGKPDPVDFTRRYLNAAILLDAAAASIGLRIVRDPLTGTVTAQGASSASSQVSANLDRPWQRISGGDFSAEKGDLPASVVCTFRKIKQYLLRANGQLHTITKSVPASVQGSTQSRSLTVHCAAYADYDTGDSLQNGTALDDLAGKIRDDFYAWAAKTYDLTFAGIQNWTPTGFDDCILWSFGHPQGGQLQAQTRVQTLPPNFWPDICLASDSTKEIVEPRMMAVANEDIAAGEEGEVSLYDSFSHDTGKDVELTNISGVEWQEDKRGWAEGIGDADWLGTPAECPE